MRVSTYQKYRRRRASRMKTPLLRHSGYLALGLLTAFAKDVHAQSNAAAVTMNARWGQASALLGSLFVVQGGKTQGTSGGGYTYTSGPNDASMFALDLSTPFSVASPPWQNVSISSASTAAPAVSFHTLSPINSTSLLLFGGDGSPTVPVQTNNDSAYIVHLDQSSSQRIATYASVGSSWSQPMRRIYHTSESNVDGSVWIMGGEKADGSDLLLSELWTLNINATSPRFGLGSATPPGSIVGSTSTLLSDGTLLLLGGMDASGQLQSMQQVYAYSTKSQKWTQTNTQASSEILSKRQSTSSTDSKFPPSRRNHVAVSLPDQRVFMQGGASADLSTVYSDAWILDWSINPPVWTQLNTTGGPAARYGHAAVAYGRQVVLALGWSGGNAADSSVHVFDGTSLTASSDGTWSGGSWTSSYAPDPQAMQSSSSSDTTGSNGSSSSSGGTTTSSGSGSGSGSNTGSGGTSTTGGGFPTNPNSGPNGTANEDSGPSDGAKAGAAIGAIIGAGLVVGGAYAVYRRRRSQDYRRYGDASGGLLDGPDRRAGSEPQSGFMLEKGYMQGDYDRPYHRTDRRDLGAGLTGGAYYGRKRGRSEGTPWTLGNVGHAMEGSGPHFRERLAILTGLGKRESQRGTRFDMLADEVDGSSILRPQHAALVADEQDEEVDNPLWHNQPLQEHSYARVGDDDLTMGDIGRSYDYYGAHQNDDYMRSPFEDVNEEVGSGRAMGARAGVGLLAGAGMALVGKRAYDKLNDDAADQDDRYDVDDHRSDVGSHDGPSGGPSVQSHSTTGKSDVPSSARSGDTQSPGGIVSFSDSSSFGRASGNNYLLKRSPTWWDRFRGNALLERSASGRLLTGPGATMPIRDPAPPPLVSNLEAITESPRSRDVSEAVDPFADSNGGQDLPTRTTHAGELDEMGRRVGSSDNGSSPFSSYQHGRSVSSLGSARTNASSHFESRIRGMDIVQRVRTGSSRRTASTVRTGSSTSDYSDSEPALSRGPTILLPRNLGPLDETDTTDSVLGSGIWQAASQPAAPDTGNALGDVAEEEAEPASALENGLQGNTFLSPLGDRKDWRASNVSETPSITPLTTKRARLNPLMTAQLFPSPVTAKSPSQPFSAGGSVRDRVKAIESQQNSAQTNMPDSSSSSIWTASLSSAHSLNLLATTPTSVSMTISPTVTTTTDTASGLGVGMERHASTSASSLSTSTGAASGAGAVGARGGDKTKKIKYTHGLVPKAQLFVANPDDRAGSRRVDGSTDSA